MLVIVSCEREVEELLDIDEAVGSRLIEISRAVLWSSRVFKSEMNMSIM
ncbi:hypothetical protein QUV80_12255 [Paraclostridium benzoelyticum]|nr:hypothetical protein [Paraclostridium benzoelyticum]